MSTDRNPRRTYHKPQLKRYGDLKTLTKAVAVEGISPDGAGFEGQPNKTN